MADILGKQLGDYTHFRALHKQGRLQSHLREKQSKHNFNALGSVDGRMVTKAELNAQAVGFMYDNLDAISAQVDEILYTDFRLNEYIPMHTNVPEGVRMYSYVVMDGVARGAFIDQQGSMPTNARVSLRHLGYPLHYAGIMPEWNLEDVRYAMTAGIALDTETIRIAAEGCMDHIEIVGLQGDESRGLKGLTTLSTDSSEEGSVSLTTRTASDKLIDGMTGEEMVKLISSEVVKFITDTKEVFGRRFKKPMCVYLPIIQASRITEEQLTLIHTDKTAWDYVAVNNAWTKYTGKPLQLKWLEELDGAGKDANDNAADRMIIGFNDRDVMEMAMPFGPRPLTVQTRDYTIQAPMEYKISGLNVKRPAGIRYIDRI